MDRFLRFYCGMRGFTLVETLIMITVVGITTALVIPEVGHVSSDYQADRAADAIAGAFRFAESEAVRTGSPVGVQVKPAHAMVQADNGNWLRVFDSGGATIEHPVNHRPYQTDFDSWTGGVTVVSFTSDSTGTVTFSALGDPAPAGGANCVVRAGDAQRTIFVRSGAGRVEVQ